MIKCSSINHYRLNYRSSAFSMLLNVTRASSGTKLYGTVSAYSDSRILSLSIDVFRRVGLYAMLNSCKSAMHPKFKRHSHNSLKRFEIPLTLSTLKLVIRSEAPRPLSVSSQSCEVSCSGILFAVSGDACI